MPFFIFEVSSIAYGILKKLCVVFTLVNNRREINSYLPWAPFPLKNRSLRARSPKKLAPAKSVEVSFFALPSKQGPVQGRFKPAHDSAELVAGLLISLGTKVAACVRRFETLTPPNHGRPALALSFWSCVWIGEHFTSQLSLLMPYEPGLGRDRVKKRYLHAHHTVFFMYNPEAKLRGLC